MRMRENLTFGVVFLSPGRVSGRADRDEGNDVVVYGARRGDVLLTYDGAIQRLLCICGLHGGPGCAQMRNRQGNAGRLRQLTDCLLYALLDVCVCVPASR